MATPSASLPHVTEPRPERDRRTPTRAVMSSLAITTMWAVVFLTSLLGGDVTTGATTVPVGVFVAFFACIGTFFTARYGLRDDD
jgi:hypothetical protein